ncbi:chemotaxis protein CheA [Sphingomonas sp. BK235]|uniref:chemotaxis protein CheA n=1 Tax=Sphingomonas sp. BK235 TaxID=2512131 RepID=UPI00105074EF|nr:chemotaxis protein CheA [Sphingomonas sp. BK235]TCP29659.1 two-component system chemotaxis sensor kinase CheA [Sphingomonas sp. BK235]
MSDLLLTRFVEEARELLQSAAAGLLVLERTPGDDAAINAVFRAVHTLKGSSGLFDAPALTRLVHAGEDLLAAVRAGTFALDGAVVDELLDSFDQVAAFVDQLARDGRLGPEAERVAAQGVAVLRAHLGAPRDGAGMDAPDAAPRAAPADWLAGFDAAALADATARRDAGEAVLVLRYTPEPGCFYTGTDPVAAMLQLPGLVALAVAPREPWQPGADFDPYQCNLCLTALTVAPRAAVEEAMVYELDQCALRLLSPPDPAAPAETVPAGAAAAPDGAPAPDASPVRALVTTQLRLLETYGHDPVRLSSIAVVIANLLRSLDHDLLGESWQAVLAEAAAKRDVAPLCAFLATLDPLAEAEPARPAAALAAPPPLPAAPPLPATPRRGPDAGDGAPAPAAAPATPRTLRVDQARIDALMTLIGELVVSKNALPFLARRAEQIHGSREMAREIKEQYAVIDRLTQELQGAVMQVRMLPVAEIFDRFPRLVRDLGRRLDKQVELVVEGQDTAADKTIVEALGDPLLHVVRNSLDHGIEPADARVAAGKPAAATLRLRAFQDTDSVIVEVSDDGRGIDPAAIRDAAVAKAMVTRDVADRLSDQEALNLIYRPGFSTAATVSDLSGRGVGMDVVLSTVHKLGGRVSVQSQIGRGTTTRLTLPLSMAVTRVMVVEIAGSLYGIPMDLVVQTVRLRADAIRRVGRDEVFVLRDAIVPLVRMARRLGAEAAARAADERGEAVLVCRVGDETVGLVIDDFREGMDVILTPMDGILAAVPGYCGTTLLGDGRVLLILDLKELL